MDKNFELFAALTIGLAGSLHCVGMCGPLALALPRGAGGSRRVLGGRLLYNAGRTVTYAALGVLFGLAGKTLLLAGLQRGLTILAGVAILAGIVLRYIPGLWRFASVASGRLMTALHGTLASLLRTGSGQSLFLVGLLNGLLPCGLVYAALAGAAATGSAAGGAAFMALFGLGTTPMMLAISLAGPRLHAVFRGRFQPVIPVALGVLGVLFILRGLSLGIPYVSPKLTGDKPCCCHEAPGAVRAPPDSAQ
jgi:uncharacterized protein